jgi:hypothetical protein
MIMPFFIQKLGGCHAERLLSHNTELKNELQYYLLDHNQTLAEEGCNERWPLILSYLGNIFEPVMT